MAEPFEPTLQTLTRTRPRIDALTSMRFFAATYVVCFHSIGRLPAFRGYPRFVQLFLNHGYLAVSLFFILSGFVLTYNYAERWQQTGMRRFLVARLARIYPVYLLALLLQAPFYASEATPGKTAAVLCMVQSWTVQTSELPAAWNYPAWTLSVELFFYLCFPLLLRAVRLLEHSRHVGTALWLTALCSVALGGPQVAIGGRASWLSAHLPIPLFRLPEFFLGMLLARYKPVRAGSGRLPLVLSLVALGLLLTLNLHRFVTLVVVPFASLLWLMANRPGRLKRLLETRALVLLGGASYALYLLQEPVLAGLRAVLHTSRSMTLTGPLALGELCWVYLPLLVLASVVVFVWVEQPMRRWIRSLA